MAKIGAIVDDFIGGWSGMRAWCLRRRAASRRCRYRGTSLTSNSAPHDSTVASMVVLGGGTVSYERSTPVEWFPQLPATHRYLQHESGSNSGHLWHFCRNSNISYSEISPKVAAIGIILRDCSPASRRCRQSVFFLKTWPVPSRGKI